MQDIREIHRLKSPVPRPQSLAFAGNTLWMGSRATQKIYEIDRPAWAVRSETQAKGTPWGLVSVGPDLRVVVNDGDEVEGARQILRFVPGQGFDPDFLLTCPDETGSQLSFDGQTLWLSQWYNRRLLAIGAGGKVERELAAPHQICGQTFAQGAFYLVTTEDENTDNYWLTRLDPATGAAEDVARIPFGARALAHDGVNFWTNHREQHEIVCFEV